MGLSTPRRGPFRPGTGVPPWARGSAWSASVTDHWYPFRLFQNGNHPVGRRRLWPVLEPPGPGTLQVGSSSPDPRTGPVVKTGGWRRRPPSVGRTASAYELGKAPVTRPFGLLSFGCCYGCSPLRRRPRRETGRGDPLRLLLGTTLVPSLGLRGGFLRERDAPGSLSRVRLIRGLGGTAPCAGVTSRTLATLERTQRPPSRPFQY